MSCLWEQRTFFFHLSHDGVRILKLVYSVEDAPHARRPKTATSPKIVEKVTNLLLQMQDLQLGI